MPGDSRKAKEAIAAQVKQAEKAPKDYLRGNMRADDVERWVNFGFYAE